jgi:ribosomal protein S1
MNTIQEINQAIMFGNLTNTQLDSVISAVKFRRSELMKENKRSMTLGDTVKFYSTKRGMELKGNVTKIAKKYVTVDTQTGLWRVPANMLEAA